MCDCKAKLEAKLLETMKKDKPDAEDLRVELEGYGFMYSGERTIVQRPTTPIGVTYIHTFKNGKKKRKKEVISMAVSHCPHCGEKVVEDKKDQDALPGEMQHDTGATSGR